jgi:hypothetical protein
MIRRTWRAIVLASAMSALVLTSLAGARGASAAHGSRTAAVHWAHVANAGEIVALPRSQILITDIGNLDRTGGQVIIADRHDHLIWRYAGPLDIPHSAYPLPNGDILIADTGDNRVIEVNRLSHIVWSTDNLGRGGGRVGQGTLSDGSSLSYPNDAKPLPNGNILVSLRLQNRVVIISRTGRIVKDITGFLHRQHNPHFLPNGDTLIADSDANRIIEVGRKGRTIVWHFGPNDGGANGALSWPRDASLLPNGHILITDSNHSRLIEVTRSRAIVRQWTNVSHPYSADPLPNGDILVGNGSRYGVVELNRDDKIVWTLNQHASAGIPGTGGASWRIRNGSFEHPISGSSTILKYWNRNDALAYSVPPSQRVTMVRDCRVHHKGKCSGRISYEGDSNGVYFGQILKVHPGRRYRFSGWIKTSNVRTCYPCSYGQGQPNGSTAEYELALITTSGAGALAPALPRHTGTTSWQHDVVEINVPGNVHAIGIQAELRGQGTVYFDDVWLQLLK